MQAAAATGAASEQAAAAGLPLQKLALEAGSEAEWVRALSWERVQDAIEQFLSHATHCNNLA